MWNDAQSEALRVYNVLLHNGTCGDALLQKLRDARREDVRLAAALLGCFRPEDSAHEEYLAYLTRRIRPAVSVLIESNRLEPLEQLEPLFTRELTDEFLAQAIAMGRWEITVWLLQRKQQRFGFHDRDFSL